MGEPRPTRQSPRKSRVTSGRNILVDWPGERPQKSRRKVDVQGNRPVTMRLSTIADGSSYTMSPRSDPTVAAAASRASNAARPPGWAIRVLEPSCTTISFLDERERHFDP